MSAALPVLTVSHLSKKFAPQLRRALWNSVRDTARELFPRGGEAGLRPGEFWAVDDVSFDLRRGEALAVVGSNGAGKSTLLKVLYGLLKPDRGEVRLRGRAEALIELGSSFNPVLSGRENVQLSAALHGLTPRQAGALLERVVEFSELGEFIDAPVQSYSSGMRARLAYALPAHLDPDVLLVDEALAVGDAGFQRKCALHMRSYLAGGGALLLVSHNSYQIRAVCSRGILLHAGRLEFSGTAEETLNAMFEQRLGAVDAAPPAPVLASGPIVIEDVLVQPLQGDVIRTGEPLRIVLRYRAGEAMRVLWGFRIWTADQWVCVTGELNATPYTIRPGRGELKAVIPRLPLAGGRYVLRAAILDATTSLAVATRGLDDPAVAVDVRAPADMQSNIRLFIDQLVTVDVDWEQPTAST